MKIAALAVASALLVAPAFAYEKFEEATLLGITLGKPLTLPACALNANGYVAETVAQTCVRAWPESGPVRTYDIGIPRDRRPAFLRGYVIEVEVVAGRVEEIEISVSDTAAAGEQLKEKFGDPDDADRDGANWNVSNGRTVLAVVRLDRSGVILAQTPNMIERGLAERQKAPHL